MTKRGIRRNKGQALYKYLPNSWASYVDKEDLRLGENSYTVRVISWNLSNFENFYPMRVHDNIKRHISSFGASGGDTKFFNGYLNVEKFSFVRASENDGHADILVDIDPLLFYCPKCGYTYQANSRENFAMLRCDSCKIKLKQLQFGYSCNCGYSSGVQLPDRINNYKYFPNSQKGTYTFSYKEGANYKSKEMKLNCPQCKKILFPKNILDGSHFKAHSTKTINLIKKDEGNLFQYGLKAKKTIISRWLDIIDLNQYLNIIKNQEAFFSDSNVESDIDFIDSVKKLVEMSKGLIDEETAKNFVLIERNKGNGTDTNINDILHKVELNLKNDDENMISLIASNIIEYFTILDVKRKLDIENVIDLHQRFEQTSNKDEILDLNRKLGIDYIQLSYDIEIINSTFGYTRKEIDPKQVTSGTLNLVPFMNGKNNQFQVFNASLETEGILIQFDRFKIIDWLYRNKLIEKEQIPLNDEESLKVWFLNNINPGEIDLFNENKSDYCHSSISVMVFKLLHSLSHAFLKSAGVLSGLDKDSLSEVIFTNIPAIFIYANTNQGLALGALSGMFEQKYSQFLEFAFDETKTCTFDPLCSDNEYGACASCMYLSDVSCNYFNKYLSRHFLHGTSDFKGYW